MNYISINIENKVFHGKGRGKWGYLSKEDVRKITEYFELVANGDIH